MAVIDGGSSGRTQALIAAEAAKQQQQQVNQEEQAKAAALAAKAAAQQSSQSSTSQPYNRALINTSQEPDKNDDNTNDNGFSNKGKSPRPSIINPKQTNNNAPTIKPVNNNNPITTILNNVMPKANAEDTGYVAGSDATAKQSAYTSTTAINAKDTVSYNGVSYYHTLGGAWLAAEQNPTNRGGGSTYVGVTDQSLINTLNGLYGGSNESVKPKSPFSSTGPSLSPRAGISNPGAKPNNNISPDIIQDKAQSDANNEENKNYDSGLITVIGTNYTTQKPMNEEIVGPTTIYKNGIIGDEIEGDQTRYIPVTTPSGRVVQGEVYDLKTGLVIINNPFAGYTDAQLDNMYGANSGAIQYKESNPIGSMGRLGVGSGLFQFGGKVYFTENDQNVANAITSGKSGIATINNYILQSQQTTKQNPAPLSSGWALVNGKAVDTRSQDEILAEYLNPKTPISVAQHDYSMLPSDVRQQASWDNSIFGRGITDINGGIESFISQHTSGFSSSNYSGLLRILAPNLYRDIGNSPNIVESSIETPGAALQGTSTMAITGGKVFQAAYNNPSTAIISTGTILGAYANGIINYAKTNPVKFGVQTALTIGAGAVIGHAINGESAIKSYPKSYLEILSSKVDNSITNFKLSDIHEHENIDMIRAEILNKPNEIETSQIFSQSLQENPDIGYQRLGEYWSQYRAASKTAGFYQITGETGEVLAFGNGPTDFISDIKGLGIKQSGGEVVGHGRVSIQSPKYYIGDNFDDTTGLNSKPVYSNDIDAYLKNNPTKDELIETKTRNSFNDESTVSRPSGNYKILEDFNDVSGKSNFIIDMSGTSYNVDPVINNLMNYYLKSRNVGEVLSVSKSTSESISKSAYRSVLSETEKSSTTTHSLGYLDEYDMITNTQRLLIRSNSNLRLATIPLLGSGSELKSSGKMGIWSKGALNNISVQDNFSDLVNDNIQNNKQSQININIQGSDIIQKQNTRQTQEQTTNQDQVIKTKSAFSPIEIGMTSNVKQNKIKSPYMYFGSSPNYQKRKKSSKITVRRWKNPSMFSGQPITAHTVGSFNVSFTSKKCKKAKK